MKVVIRRVLERTELRAVGPRPERVLRRGITLVPRDGVRVSQPCAPATAAVPAPVAAA
jgi:cytochrome P450